VSVSAQKSGSTMTFEKFWAWLKDHANCILRAGSADAYFYDQEDFHWVLSVDAEQNAVVELLRGKRLVADLVIERQDVQFVQSSPDVEQPEHVVFEVISNVQGEAVPIYHFLMSHGVEEPTHKTEFKH
jgi:hypothetical protein